MPIHEYIQNKVLTITREVVDPILSQNIDLFCTGIVWGLCQQNGAGRSVQLRLSCMKTLMHSHIGYDGYSGKTKAIGKYTAY